MAVTYSTAREKADSSFPLLRHKWKALFVFVAVVGAAAAVTALSPRTYRSEAKLFVRLGRENATVDPTATLGRDPVIAVPTMRDSEINSVVEILSSRVLLEKVVDAIGPEALLERPGTAGDGGRGTRDGGRGIGDAAHSPPTSRVSRPTSHLPSPAASVDWRGWLERMNLATPLSERDRAIVWLVKRLSVKPVRKSEVVVVSCDAQSPELAQKVVSRLVEFYLAEHGRWNRTTGAHDFFAQQTSVTQTRLAQAEERLREFKNRTGIVSPEGQRQLLAARISRLEDELAQNAAAAAAAEARIRGHRETLSSEPTAVVTSQIAGYSDDGTDRMREQFYVLQLQEQAAAVKYTEAHPVRQQMHEQAAAAKGILNQEGRSRTQVTTAPTKRREQAELAVAADEPALAALAGGGVCAADGAGTVAEPAQDASTSTIWKSPGCNARWTSARGAIASTRRAWSRPASTRLWRARRSRTSAWCSRPLATPCPCGRRWRRTCSWVWWRGFRGPWVWLMWRTPGAAPPSRPQRGRRNRSPRPRHSPAELSGKPR